ncbi:MAG: polysaccharide deacetylase family protein [Candidatus Dormibacteraeota bacterium]|nr:polysaccharide deacetylase family protein [Candidatus Dormibacteraeota bacterium]
MRPAVEMAVRAWSRMPVPLGSAMMLVGYHRIADRADDLTVHPSRFEEQMRWLAAHRDTLPTVDVERAAAPARQWPHRCVAVTIDDAWEDVYRNGLVVMAELKLPVTLYVPSKLIGTPEYMTREQVLECAAAGLTIGGHTRSHADLRKVDHNTLESELRGGREDLEDLMGRAVTQFAYPFGHFDARARAAVIGAGYTSAITTRRGWARPGVDPFTIPRSVIEDVSLATFVASVRGGLSVLSAADAVRRRREG